MILFITNTNNCFFSKKNLSNLSSKKSFMSFVPTQFLRVINEQFNMELTPFKRNVRILQMFEIEGNHMHVFHSYFRSCHSIMMHTFALMEPLPPTDETFKSLIQKLSITMASLLPKALLTKNTDTNDVLQCPYIHLDLNLHMLPDTYTMGCKTLLKSSKLGRLHIQTIPIFVQIFIKILYNTLAPSVLQNRQYEDTSQMIIHILECINGNDYDFVLKLFDVCKMGFITFVRHEQELNEIDLVKTAEMEYQRLIKQIMPHFYGEYMNIIHQVINKKPHQPSSPSSQQVTTWKTNHSYMKKNHVTQDIRKWLAKRNDEQNRNQLTVGQPNETSTESFSYLPSIAQTKMEHIFMNQRISNNDILMVNSAGIHMIVFDGCDMSGITTCLNSTQSKIKRICFRNMPIIHVHPLLADSRTCETIEFVEVVGCGAFSTNIDFPKMTHLTLKENTPNLHHKLTNSMHTLDTVILDNHDGHGFAMKYDENSMNVYERMNIHEIMRDQKKITRLYLLNYTQKKMAHIICGHIPYDTLCSVKELTLCWDFGFNLMTTEIIDLNVFRNVEHIVLQNLQLDCLDIVSHRKIQKSLQCVTIYVHSGCVLNNIMQKYKYVPDIRLIIQSKVKNSDGLYWRMDKDIWVTWE